MAKKRTSSEIDNVDDATECNIRFDKIELVGNHRAASLKCGHIFGEKCIHKWINDCPTRLKCCPTCRHRALTDDIRIIHASKIVVIDDWESRFMISELDKLEKRLDAFEEQISTFEKIKKKLDNLKRLGVVYVECEICDQGFTNEDRKRVHQEQHYLA